MSPSLWKFSLLAGGISRGDSARQKQAAGYCGVIVCSFLGPIHPTFLYEGILTVVSFVVSLVQVSSTLAWSYFSAPHWVTALVVYPKVKTR